MTSPSANVSVITTLKQSAKLSGDKPFFELADGSVVTYTQGINRVQRLASGFRNKLGLASGARIALMALNSHRFIETYYAVPWGGCVVVPVNIRWSPEEILFSFLDCGVECVVLDDVFSKLVPVLKQKVPSIKTIVHMNETPAEGCVGYEQLIAESTPMDSERVGGDDTFGIFYTGGTTGQSKGVMLTHGNIFLNAMGMQSYFQYSPAVKYLHCAPMFHLADTSQTFGVTMGAGCHVFIPKFDPAAFVEAATKYKFTTTVMVPVMISMIVNFPNIESADLSSIERVLYGASAMSETLLLAAMKVFPKAQWTQGYGMTETSPIITMNGPESHVPGNQKIRAVGKPVFWVEACVLDANDREVERGTVGEVCTRGGHVMKGYYNRPDLTESALRNGWMHTGDGGYMDQDGFIFLVDRLKDMIISGGENVYSAEVENVVMSHPNVQSVAVIGTPHDALGELVTAIVVPKPGTELDEASVVAHCKAHIGGYKCPRKVVVRDSLPVSGAGKILKHLLRAEFWGENQHVYATDNQTTSYK